MRSDLRHAARTLLARPAFTAVAVLALALGTGANTMIFSVVNAVLLRPLPYADADRVFAIQARGPVTEEESSPALSPLDLRDLRAGTAAFEEIAGVGFSSFDLTGTARPAQLRAALVTPGFFRVLGVQPIVGRVLAPEEIATGAPVVVLDADIWRSQFNGDPAIVGRAITLDGRPFTVVGVLPHLTFRDEQAYELWATVDPREVAAVGRAARGINVFGRLRPGVSAEAAREELAVVSRRLAAQYPKENGGWTFGMQDVRAWQVGDLRGALLVLLGAVAMVLLVACTNVAHMLLARASQRGRELALRASLGATRARLVRQLLTESLLLAAAGGAAGVLLAYLLLPALVAAAPLDATQRAAVSLDLRVLLATVGVAVATGFVFGLWPALSASRPDLQAALKGFGAGGATQRGGVRARSLLVASEIALASMLLVGAGLFVKSFDRLQRMDPGYDGAHAASVGLVLPDNVYPRGVDKREFLRAVFERLRAQPHVETVAAVNFLPRFGAVGSEATVPGRPEAEQPRTRAVSWRVMTPDYFRALRIPLVRGRTFDERDAPDGVKVAIVSRTLATRYFGADDPVGRELSMATFGPPARLLIVGVAGDVRQSGRTEAVEADVYLPYAQHSWGYVNVVVRGRTADPATLLATIERAVRAVDPSRPIFAPTNLAEFVEGDVRQPRFGAALMTLFALVAATLAVVGVFAVAAHAVAARTREIGIRVALGGQASQVIALMMRPAMRVIALGVAAGLAAAAGASRLVASQLHGVSPLDPLVLAGVAAAVGLVGLVASYVPTRRALGISPTVALRGE
jgi:putative ABC transport system permease protein